MTLLISKPLSELENITSNLKRILNSTRKSKTTRDSRKGLDRAFWKCITGHSRPQSRLALLTVGD